MTMPHLMNCGHSDDGWCLACVKTLEDERYNTVIEAGKYEYALQAALQRQETAEKQLAQLREQLAKAEAERPMTNGYAYHRLASQVEYAISLLDGNEDESDSPCGELVEKLIDHLNHYESVKCQLAKAEAEAKRYRGAWASVRKQWDYEATIAAGWNVPSGDRLACLLRQCIDDMDDLIPPTEQGTTHD